MKLAVKFAITAAAASLLTLSGTAQAQDEVAELPWDEAEVVDAAEDALEEAADAVEDAIEEPADAALEQTVQEEQVLSVVDAFMAGLAAKDADAMSAVVLDTAFLAFVRPGEDGDAARTLPLSRAITSLAETVPDISEPIRDPRVMSDGSVAMVWAPYDFYVDGTRNHCGVNVFSLLNRDGTWLIASLVYSYIPENCPEEAEENTEEVELAPEDSEVVSETTAGNVGR